MKAHKGMRPQDIVILLQIVAWRGKLWHQKDLAHELFISSSEVSESLTRSAIVGLVDESGKKVFTNALEELLVHGLKYVFPAQPGAPAAGIPTAHAAPVMNKFFHSSELYVWPAETRSARGISIEPLYPTVPKAAMQDQKLYALLALTDVLRIGRVREISKAKEILKAILKDS